MSIILDPKLKDVVTGIGKKKDIIMLWGEKLKVMIKY